MNHANCDHCACNISRESLISPDDIEEKPLKTKLCCCRRRNYQEKTMKDAFVCFFALIFVANGICAFNVTEYSDYVEGLSRNNEFLDEYARWSLKLFSEANYLYGEPFGSFPCPIAKESTSGGSPTTVHTLRPGDVQCVAALGDSLTAALGAHAITPAGLVIENRGASWSMGGDYTFSRVLSLPNILREYNPKLKGYSVKTSVIFLAGQNSTHNHLNVAKSGDRSYHMIDQARILFERLKSGKDCDLKNDWKIITFFIGGNDLCIFCDDLNKHNPVNFTNYVTETLDFLKANIPRTFVNLVLVLDVRGVELLNAGGPVCKLLHKKTCPCAAFPTEDQATTLSQWIPSYHQMLLDVVNSGRYETNDDFTVVIQPFMARTELPRMADGNIDFSYFAPDCFHFSGKGHSRAALSLWNNMLEPVGAKQWSWHEGDKLLCPTGEHPYFFTSKNSPQRFERMSQHGLKQ